MPRPLTVSLLILLLLASVMRAENQKDPAPAPDYSRATLLYIFSQKEAPDTEADVKLEYSTPNWTFRFLPFLLPIIPNRNFGTASIMPVVDPFALLNLGFPQTADTYPDYGDQNRYRKRMLRSVSAANRADNARHRSGG